MESPGEPAPETTLHAETWHAFYQANFHIEGSTPPLLRAPTPSDVSSRGAEWRLINRPEVESAFGTLELYDKPDADRETINSVTRELLLEFHPDKVPLEGRSAANAETVKINEAREVALAYVAERDNG